MTRIKLFQLLRQLGKLNVYCIDKTIRMTIIWSTVFPLVSLGELDIWIRGHELARGGLQCETCRARLRASTKYRNTIELEGRPIVTSAQMAEVAMDGKFG